jgi:chemotaxis signal transduction protein
MKASINLSKFIIFSLEDQLWAAPLTKASQFIESENIEALPQTDRRIRGLTYSRGNLITVLNTAEITGLKMPKTESTKLLLFNFADDYYAWTIKEGGETVRPKEIFIDYSRKIFKKYLKYNKRRVYILDLEKVWKILGLYG